MLNRLIRSRLESSMRRPFLLGAAWLLLTSSLLFFVGSAQAQSIAGPATVVVREISNTCGEPLGTPDVAAVELEESGNLIAVAVPPEVTNATPIEGKRSGSLFTLGFEVIEEEDGATLYDPAGSALTLDAGGTTLSGTLNWESFSAVDCFGTESWSATRPAAGTPGNLSGGGWVLTIVSLTDSCGPVDPTPVVVPVSIVQSGSLLEVVPPDVGQTRFRGRVTGQALSLGLALREDDAVPTEEITVYDARDSAFVIDASFDSFSGTMVRTSFSPRDCSGVDEFEFFLPEPGFGLGLLLGAAALGMTPVGRRVTSVRNRR